MHLSFRPFLPDPQSQNPQRSCATPAVLLSRIIQIWPKSERLNAQVIYSRALKLRILPLFYFDLGSNKSMGYNIYNAIWRYYAYRISGSHADQHIACSPIDKILENERDKRHLFFDVSYHGCRFVSMDDIRLFNTQPADYSRKRRIFYLCFDNPLL